MPNQQKNTQPDYDNYYLIVY